MSDITPDEIADLKGLNCPMPVLKTKKALDKIEGGKILRVDLTDAGSKSDLPAMIKRTGNELLEMSEADGVYTFFIKKSKLICYSNFLFHQNEGRRMPAAGNSGIRIVFTTHTKRSLKGDEAEKTYRIEEPAARLCSNHGCRLTGCQ